jgi:RND family efflux transporter MFP subunit
VAVLVLGCASRADRAPAEPGAAPGASVEAVRVEPADGPLPLRTSGRLAPKAEVPLGFTIGGVVDRVLVDEGERVAAGQTLARLDPSEIDARVAEAESGFEKARRDLGRARQLHRDSVATLEEVQNAETAVAVAEARLESARFNRRHAAVTAPGAGRIHRRHVEAGEQVAAGQPVVTVGMSGRGWVVRVGLAARDVVALTRGDSAHVRFDAWPDRRYRGTVTEIADAASRRSGAFEVEVRVEAPPAGARSGADLKAGFIGAVVLYPSAGPSYVRIPAVAVVEGQGRRGVVYRVDGRRARRTPVRIGRVLDSTVAVTRGLEPGMLVATSGAAALHDSAAVEVVSFD